MVDLATWQIARNEVRKAEAAIRTEEGHLVCYLRDGDRVFPTHSTTGRETSRPT